MAHATVWPVTQRGTAAGRCAGDLEEQLTTRGSCIQKEGIRESTFLVQAMVQDTVNGSPQLTAWWLVESVFLDVGLGSLLNRRPSVLLLLTGVLTFLVLILSYFNHSWFVLTLNH